MKNAFLFLALTAALVACGPRTKDGAQAPTYDPMVYTDRMTGCQYLTTTHDTTLTPRIAADGIHQLGCGGVVK
jgi:hypothetical protein